VVSCAASFIVMMFPPKSGRKAVRARNTISIAALADAPPLRGCGRSARAEAHCTVDGGVPRAAARARGGTVDYPRADGAREMGGEHPRRSTRDSWTCRWRWSGCLRR
jgi:hypothetical protein